MSDNPNPPAPIVQPPAPVPNTDPTVYLKWGSAAALAASVLVLVILGKTPVDTYLNDIVLPGLGFLGIHTIAKNYNP